MNIKKEITNLVLDKYKLKVLDPLSIKSQVIKLWEELEELKEAETKEQVECELGDVLFVEQTLQTLLDNYIDKDYYFGHCNLCDVIKSLNKCDSDAVFPLYAYISWLVDYHNNNYFHKLLTPEEMLERTIEKNKSRYGEIINNCFVKSDDI